MFQWEDREVFTNYESVRIYETLVYPKAKL